VTSQPPDDSLLHVNPLTADLEFEEGSVPVTMNKFIDLVGSLLIVALGIFVLVVAFNYPPPKVVFDAIGPMGFPKAIGGFLVIGGLIQSARCGPIYALVWRIHRVTICAGSISTRSPTTSNR
jgi:hypothetical protein